MAAHTSNISPPERKIWLISATLVIVLMIVFITSITSGGKDSGSTTTVRYQQQLLTPKHSIPRAQLPSPTVADIRQPEPEPEPEPKIEPERKTSALINAITDSPPWRAERIQPGDSFATIMKRLGYSPAVVVQVMNSGPHAQQLIHLKPDHHLQLLDREDELHKLRYEINKTTRLDIDLTTTPPQALTVELPVEVRFQHTNGQINSSLYLAGQTAGLSDALIMELANIFGWDVDFTLDLRKGDRFTVIYSGLFLDGEKIDDGQIYAAELTANGRPFRAIRYKNKAGKVDYFTPQGISMRKAFSRNPLPITRITSRFNPNRLHPIFKTRRPHRGVDYGAASGTPVRATGDGKVIFKGQKSGYGNTVIIQHGQRYTTLFAHLKNFARSTKKGRTVRQSQTIAYVGQSGWATGPHLHYEFRVNGVHKNPLTVKLPPAEPVNSKEKQRFLAETQSYVKQLDSLVEQQLAATQ